MPSEIGMRVRPNHPNTNTNTTNTKNSSTTTSLLISPTLSPHPPGSTSNFKTTKRTKSYTTDTPQSLHLIYNSKPRLNLLMLFAPLATLPYYLIPSLRVPLSAFFFTCSLIALVPFADSLSFVTDHLAKHTNPTHSGLINATFGNASELIFSYFALKDKLYRVVQLSLLGSILSNLLLVLGCACFVGGLKFKVQKFTKISGSASVGMLLVGTAALALPCALKMSGQNDDKTDELFFSRFVSLVMVGMYGCYLVFQLKTHVEEFGGESEDDDDDDGGSDDKGGVKKNKGTNDDLETANNNDTTTLLSSSPPSPAQADLHLSFQHCIVSLSLITLIVISLSDILVGTIESFTNENTSINPVFVAAVIIPIFGNAAEHAASVLFAYRNKMDICLGIAIGSSIQISLLVTPLCVLMGWATDREFTLFFEGFETCAIVFSVILVSFFLVGGNSNWLIGAIFMGVYLIVAGGFWFHETERGEWGTQGIKSVEVAKLVNLG